MANNNNHLQQPLYEFLSQHQHQQNHPHSQGRGLLGSCWSQAPPNQSQLQHHGHSQQHDTTRLLSPTNTLTEDPPAMKPHPLQQQQQCNSRLKATQTPAHCPKEMNVVTLLNRFQSAATSFSSAAAAATNAQNGANSASSRIISVGRTIDANSRTGNNSSCGNNNNNNQSGAEAASQSAPYIASPTTGATAAAASHHHHHQHHPPPPPTSSSSGHPMQQPSPLLPNYQYHALLHDRLTAPLAGDHTPSGPNSLHSDNSFSHTSAIPSRSRLNSLGGSTSSCSSIMPPATGGGMLKMDEDKGSMAATLRSGTGTTKVQFLNKHLMDADRDILHSIMTGTTTHTHHQHHNTESLVDSTSPPPELLRNIYGGGGGEGAGGSSSASMVSLKRNYSPTQFAYLCDAVAAASGTPMGGGVGGVMGATAGSSNSGVACGRSISNGSSNCDSEKVSGLLASMGGGGGGANGSQPTEKKVPNSIRGDDYDVWCVKSGLDEGRDICDCEWG